jgi:hypothetical protein
VEQIIFGGANAFLETRLGSDGDDLRAFSDGSGRRLRQGLSGRRIIDPRSRRALLDERSEKHHGRAGPRGSGPGAHDLQNRRSDDDVSLLADGVQNDNSQSLLGRLALLAHLTPLLGANEEKKIRQR